MKERKDRRPDAVVFDGRIDMPHMPISVGTTEWDATGTWRYLRPQFVERIPSCQNSCPTANDIESWIAHFERGDLEKAWEAATLENPFPAIMGRVCFHPCTDGCNRCELGDPINILGLERALGDAVGEKLPPAKPFFENSGKKVAIVGSGPAGLACAYHLRRLGHDVTVFEKEKKAGGFLRYGIPCYRLPKNVLDREIDRLSEMSIRFELGRAVPDATHMQTLCQDFDAVFLAVGAHKSKGLDLEGAKTKGVITGLGFLNDVLAKRSVNLGKRTVVIGGGNTAIDAARTALRLGSEVTILYRRSLAEMPAFAEEVEAALEEGVKLKPLVAPMEISPMGGGLKLRCVKMELGEPDETGRRRPIPQEGSEITVECDSVISAIGEEIDTSIIPSALHIERGAIRTTPGGRTEWHNLFAGGDFTIGPRTVVDAIASGKVSAVAIDCELRGEKPEDAISRCRIGGDGPLLISRYVELHGAGKRKHCATEELCVQDHVVEFDEINCAYFAESSSEKTPVLDVSERIGEDKFVEVSQRMAEDSIKKEAARCFHCGRCTICDNCFIYCPDVAVSKAGDGFEINFDYCKGCGVCAEECPRAAMEMVEEPTEDR